MQSYLSIFASQMQERDPNTDDSSRINDERIIKNLAESSSMESTSNRMPLITMNRQISNTERSLKGLSAEM